jgi:murein DD-endopeptidase MepM/ murein hydrolase activator NlpD
MAMLAEQRRMSRRALLRAGAGGLAAIGGGLAWKAAGAATLVNPYKGVVPLVFPLASGTYTTPLTDSWHDARDGAPFNWSHHLAKRRRHDGVDLLPTGSLPPVYAPFSGVVVARALNGVYSEAGGGPPWRYPASDIYGNFAWIRSTESASQGYFCFFCHLQGDTALANLAAGQAVTASSRLGTMGDTGNAAGSPQLHVEIHYPAGNRFSCSYCRPKSALTAIDPFASLAAATTRS